MNLSFKVTPPNTHDGNTSDDDSEMYVEKLKSIRDAANQRYVLVKMTIGF